MQNESIEFTNIVSAAYNVHQIVAEEINKNCQKNAKIIDVGAGEGKVLYNLQNKGFGNLAGIDIVVENFKLKNIDIQTHDLNLSFPLASGSFDAVISSEVIEHIENPWHFIMEISRILKKDGIAVLTTPNVNSLLSRLGFLRKGKFRMFEDEHYKDWGHITPLTWFYLDKIFKKNNLEVIRHTYNAENNFFGTLPQILFQKVFYYIFYPIIRGELGGDINIITLKKI